MKKKIKIALCGIQEEVNTFATETMGLAKVTGNMATGFQKFEGEGLIKEYKGTATWPGGWVDAFLESPQVEFIALPLYQYSAGPTIEGKAYQQMKKDILDSLKAAMPLDGVAIQMHGAGAAEGRAQIRFDCNRGGGDYTISDGKLSFGPLLSTRMACPEDTLDGPFMRDLQRVATFFLEDSNLYLELPYDSGTMKFRPAP